MENMAYSDQRGRGRWWWGLSGLDLVSSKVQVSGIGMLNVWLALIMWLILVFSMFEHQDGVVDLEGRAKFDWHDPDDVLLGEQKEGPSINLLEQKQEQIRSLPLSCN